MEPITPTEYRGFQRAYDYFNAELFDHSLPNVLVTLQRQAHTKGYFSPERFSSRVAEGWADELALNPDTFTGRTDEEILSTLAHEMVHVWQKYHGRQPSGRYHDRQWAAKMKEIGLQPTATGEPGGKETGQSVMHYIIPQGRYAKAYARLAATGFELHWQSAPWSVQAKAKRLSKTKFTCPECGLNAWAKPDAELLCGALDHDQPATMLAEVW
jgi:hypothetical protein